MFRRVLVIIVAAAAGVVGLLGVLPAAAQQGGGNATRSFDQDTVAAGGEVVVTIEATGYGSLGGVTETLPAGFSYVSSSLTDEGEVTEVDARTVIVHPPGGGQDLHLHRYRLQHGGRL